MEANGHKLWDNDFTENRKALRDASDQVDRENARQEGSHDGNGGNSKQTARRGGSNGGKGRK